MRGKPTTNLYWSIRGEVACDEHAPVVDDVRWIDECWAPLQVAFTEAGTRYECQHCASDSPATAGPLTIPPGGGRLKPCDTANESAERLRRFRVAHQDVMVAIRFRHNRAFQEAIVRIKAVLAEHEEAIEQRFGTARSERNDNGT